MQPRKFTSVAQLAILLVFLALLSPLTGKQIEAQSTATVRPDPASLQLATGEVQTVQVRLENASRVYGIDVRGSFDPAILEIIDVDPARDGIQMTPGSFPRPDFVAANTADNGAGTFRYVITQVNPTPPASGDGMVFSFQVRARAGGTTEIAIPLVEMSDREGNLLAVSTGSTAVQVTGATAEPTGIALQPTDALSGEISSTATPLSTSSASQATPEPQATTDLGGASAAGGATPIFTATPGAGANEPVPAAQSTLSSTPITETQANTGSEADPAPDATIDTSAAADPIANNAATTGESAPVENPQAGDATAVAEGGAPAVIGNNAGLSDSDQTTGSTAGSATDGGSNTAVIFGGMAVVIAAAILFVFLKRRG